MSIQTTNKSKGVGYTRYILSSAQKSFVETLQLWLIDNFLLNGQSVREHSHLVKRVLNNNGYEESDSVVLNHLRSLYIQNKQVQPF